MSYGSTKHSESSASRRSMDGDTTEDGGDDRDESKRRSRNLSEKKRRDQFNVLINELCSMVSTSPRKMDKSTVLKATIAFLKAHNELAVQSQVQETQEDWKPSFLSNEEFTHLMLEALDGFIIVISSSGKILYLSESITSLLGYLSSEMVSGSNTIYDYILPEERNDLYTILSNPSDEKYKGQVSIVLNFRVGGLEMNEENQKYQIVKLIGYFKRWISPTDCDSKSNIDKSEGEMSESSNSASSNGCVLIATGRLIVCDLLREMSVVVDSEKNEFSSRHSLEWKFLFLDHRAPPIIGYLPFEVLGTSGYDYYHVEDLEKVATCHEALMQRGEGTSCYYRFLTKGQQWIWLQTRFYITYHQWNSKPEFIVCTHRVVSYADVMKELLGDGTVITFDENSPAPRIGPSLPKQPKLENSKGHSSLKSSSRHKNGSLSYGSLGSKRNSSVRKLELPPKFATALSSAHPVLVHSQGESPPIQIPQTVSVAESIMSSSNGMTMVCSKPSSTTVAMALHPQVTQLLNQPHQATLTPSTVPRSISSSATVALPVATYNSLPQNPALAISTSGPIQAPGPPPGISMPQSLVVGHPVIASQPCVLQDQLLKKHAELQRQIIQQQEELRRVSEQLLMAQCGWIQGDSLILPQNHNHPIPHHPQDENSPLQLQQVQCQQPLMAYSPHPAPQLPAAPSSSSTNPESGLT